MEEEIEKNHIENIFIMLKPYSIDSILSSYKKWKEVKKEIFLIPWEEKIEKCPYRLRGMLLSLHKELTSKNRLEKDLFFSLKKFFSL